MEEYNIEELVNDIDFSANSFTDINPNIKLTNREISVLDSYDINYKNCKSLTEVLYQIDNIINDSDDIEDLEWVATEISDRNYYMNTNK